MKCRITRDLGACDGWESPLVTVLPNGRRVVTAGTVIDQNEHPETDCVAAIRAGEAVPVDDECQRACGMTPEQIRAAQEANTRMYSVDDDVDETEADDDEEDSE